MIKQILLAALFISAGFGVQAEEKILPLGYGAKTAGFWISRHPSPDSLILTQAGIAKFNQAIQNDLKLTKDIFSVTQDLKTETLLVDLEKIAADFIDKGYFSKEGVRDDKDFLGKVKRNMHLSGVVMGVVPRYGVVLRFTDQRLLPTDEPLYAQKDDVEFDEVQNSGLDMGTPVAVVHVSADKKWYYVFTDISDGWVKAQDVALGSVEEVKLFAQEQNMAVVIAPKADIFLNEAMRDFAGYIRMGTRLPMAGVDEGKVRVTIPAKDKEGGLVLKEAFVNEADISFGYLPYTARHIYSRAFAMLNQPYGWGDMNGEQDCSRFLQMVYATVGIHLPRNSKEQSQVGIQAELFDEKTTRDVKLAALTQALGAQTILPMKGHIMMYLGSIDGVPYAIHETSGYKQVVGDKEITHKVNRVIVSDLSLGEGSLKGSLLKRLNKIVVLKNNE